MTTPSATRPSRRGSLRRPPVRGAPAPRRSRRVPRTSPRAAVDRPRAPTRLDLLVGSRHGLGGASRRRRTPRPARAPGRKAPRLGIGGGLRLGFRRGRLRAREVRRRRFGSGFGAASARRVVRFSSRSRRRLARSTASGSSGSTKGSSSSQSFSRHRRPLPRFPPARRQVGLEQVSRRQRVLCRAGSGSPAGLRHPGRESLIVGLNRHVQGLLQLLAEGLRRLRPAIPRSRPCSVAARRRPAPLPAPLQRTTSRTSAGSITATGRTRVPLGSLTAQPIRAVP